MDSFEQKKNALLIFFFFFFFFVAILLQINCNDYSYEEGVALATSHLLMPTALTLQD